MNASLPRHGGQLHAIAAQFGLDQADLLDLSANISPQGPPRSATTAMEAAFADGACFTQYPDLEQAALKQVLAAYAGTSANEVLVANGFVPLLDATVRALGIRTCLVPMPCFNEYRRVLEHNGIAITPRVLRPEHGFHYSFDSLRESACEAVLLANLQNPTGVLCDRGALLAFIRRAQEQGMYVLLDEAFIDYVPGHSVTALVAECTHLVVFRSLTKFFGMPGLRVAYACAGGALRARIETYLAPWPVTTLASIAASASVSDQRYSAAELTLNEVRRTYLRRELEMLGLRVYEGAANFLFFGVGQAESCWRTLIVEHGVVLRRCDGYEGLGEGFLRVAVREEQATQRFVRALRAVLNSPVACLQTR